MVSLGNPVYTRCLCKKTRHVTLFTILVLLTCKKKQQNALNLYDDTRNIKEAYETSLLYKMRRIVASIDMQTIIGQKSQ